jgi:hypothetical protein
VRNYRGKYLKYSLAILAIAFLLAWALKFYSNKGELTALIDVTLTTIALMIAILEIFSLRTVANQIQRSVTNATVKIESILSLSEISRSSKTIEEIQAYLGSGRLESAYLRMKDLRKVIVETKIKGLFLHLEDPTNVNLYCTKLFSDIDDLGGKIYHEGNIDLASVSSNLEQLSLTFTTLVELIKKSNYGNTTTESGEPTD